METLGEYLKREREFKSISIEDIAKATKINPYYLKALEKDDFDSLPGKVFIKGFTKMYAKFVGLDMDEVLQKHEDIFGQEIKTEAPKLNRFTLNRPKGKWLSIAVILCVLLLAAIYFGAR
jgi:cytoskeletal protein RodZ